MQITFTESSITTLRPGRHRDRTQPGLSGAGQPAASDPSLSFTFRESGHPKSRKLTLTGHGQTAASCELPPNSCAHGVRD